MKTFALWIALLAVAAFLAGCRASAQPTATPDPNIRITLAPAQSFAVGQATLVIVVHDGQGRPIDDARIEVTGDMNHAGMKPSLGSADGGQDGRYAVPFEWTMSGDWFLIVKVTLPDGRETSERFELTVVSGPA